MSDIATEVAVKRGHPKGLYVLFFTEMWERFSYYGMRSILVYYMIKHLMFAQDKASQIYGLYTGFVYFTPLLGGMLADRFLGQRRSVILGGILMAIGEFTLMSPSLFYVGLTFLILGNGCFKPNISTQVGSLYEQGDHRRDRAFNIFYMGINLGAFFSPLVCGTLGELYGWHWGFMAAGIGMIAGLILYMWGQKYLAKDNIMKKATGEVEKKNDPLTKSDWGKILALVVLCTFNILFWAIYEQQGNTTALWADANTNRMILGWEMPASWVQSFNPLMIFIFTPLLTMFWGWQDRRKKEPSSTAKMAIGCFLLAASFVIMIPAARLYADTGSTVSLWWLIINTFILTIGELYLSPVGLSLVTKIAPPRLVSTMMGMWFLSSFFGNYLCGFLGTFWEKMSKESFFIMLVVLACVAGLGILATLKPLKRAMGHEHPETADV
jgi:POT family proton-dependent oligopeptide transporter